jgi:hypothetical protein
MDGRSVQYLHRRGAGGGSDEDVSYIVAHLRYFRSRISSLIEIKFRREVSCEYAMIAFARQHRQLARRDRLCSDSERMREPKVLPAIAPARLAVQTRSTDGGELELVLGSFAPAGLPRQVVINLGFQREAQ